jgi:hypothetical protein
MQKLSVTHQWVHISLPKLCVQHAATHDRNPIAKRTQMHAHILAQVHVWTKIAACLTYPADFDDGYGVLLLLPSLCKQPLGEPLLAAF